MPKYLEVKHILKILEKQGFFFVSQKGSHKKYRKKFKPKITVIIPVHNKELPLGTFKSILRQSKLDQKDFE